MEKKRLFFGFSVEAPWPSSYPQGKLVDESNRHITLAFLGHQIVPEQKQLNSFPKPPFSLSPIGLCDRILFLPEDTPRIVAYHVTCNAISNYQPTILEWLKEQNYPTDPRPFLPHMTLARSPFNVQEWKEAFKPLPCMMTGIHLYESLGNQTYSSLWSIPFHPPFEEFEHTADMAFHIRAQNYPELYLHSAAALSFKYPPLFSFITNHLPKTLDQVIKQLNATIAKCDAHMGCPFKAVSYHGLLKSEKTLQWEMIVDV